MRSPVCSRAKARCARARNSLPPDGKSFFRPSMTSRPRGARNRSTGMDRNLRQPKRQGEFRRFALEHVSPWAELHDRQQRLSDHIVPALARRGWFAPFLPESHGGSAMDMVTYGALHEEMGRACSSVRSLLTVHDMVCLSILRWGSEALRERW